MNIELDVDDIGVYVIDELANRLLGYDQTLTHTRVTDIQQLTSTASVVKLEINEMGKKPQKVAVTISVAYDYDED